MIGGWAVYCYNPWYGSVDIDLVTNAGTRQHLMRHLAKTRGFVKRKNPPFRNSVAKIIPPDGEIIIDFIPSNHSNCFEGRDENCPLDLLYGRTVLKEISPGFLVTVPERSFLLLLKLKAAWDRAYRIHEHISHNEDWENGKLKKDRADILSLIDPKNGRTDLDFMFLGDMVRKYAFLLEILTIIPDDRDALQMYGGMDRDSAQRAIDDLLRLIG
ncbi:MAG: hypothetical protein NTW33_01175 [Methanoregula sp.]|nr:hypothetical protein [Methanoregula sp.]